MTTKRAATGGVTTALVYCRVSTEDQANDAVLEGLGRKVRDERGHSLDMQLRACREYVARQGWIIGGEYQDVLSGRRDDRPKYQALLSEVRRLHAANASAAIVVARLDRFGRKLLAR